MIANSTTKDTRLTTQSNGQQIAVSRRAHRARLVYERRPRVSTWLGVAERDLVTAAGFERFETIHRDSARALFDDFLYDRADAAVISVARVSPADDRYLETLRQGFPGRPLIGLVLEADASQVLSRTLELGRNGIEFVVDAREPSGWNRLRAALCSPRMMDTFRAEVLTRIHAEIGAVSRGLARFFDLIFDPGVHRTKQIAADLGVGRSAFHSRFHRAFLPSARRYLDWARLVRVAFIGEEAALTGTDISNRVHASSPQSLHRSIRCLTGMSFRAFRYRYDGSGMLDRFVSDLVVPYLEPLQSFDPCGTMPRRASSCYCHHHRA
jgi:AraC-like DNA-binding protein